MVRPRHETEDTKMASVCVSRNNYCKRPGSKRCGKNSRIKWNDGQMVNDMLNKENFTKEEEDLIIKMHAAIGSRWAIIAQQLPGRSENDVKNHWNSKLRKKLQEMGIDPITHKPFSQIFADFGCINNALITTPESEPSLPSLSKELKHALVLPKPVDRNPSVSFSHSDNRPIDLLSQLQAIRFVTETSNWSKPILQILPPPPTVMVPSPSSSSSGAPSLSSSTSSCDLAAFKWQDFLLDDPENKEPGDDTETQAETLQTRRVNNESIGQVELEASGINGGSKGFVESIMHKETEMFLGLFPDQLLEEEFYD